MKFNNTFTIKFQDIKYGYFGILGTPVNPMNIKTKCHVIPAMYLASYGETPVRLLLIHYHEYDTPATFPFSAMLLPVFQDYSPEFPVAHLTSILHHPIG